MDESDDTNKPEPAPPTPEVAQLLKLIEMQTAAQRDRLAAMPRAYRSNSFRYGSLIVIVVFALGSVAAMEWMISQLPKVSQPAAAQAATPGAIISKSANSGTNPPGKSGGSH
jgi:hypothetical protein